MATNINNILQWFKTGKTPTEQQFSDSWTSFWHKEESIPQATIHNLESDLLLKADHQDHMTHLSDPQAHSAMRKSMELEPYKVIDSLILEGVYNVSNEDFGKTLRYNGTSTVTIVLSATVPAVTGNRFKIYQAGAGQVTFAVNGYLLHHGNDVVPKLYGVYSTATIEITDVSPFAVYLYGKLELA